MIASVNPATAEVVAEFEPHTPEQVDRALSAAVAAQRQWRTTPIAERMSVLRAAADVLRSRRDAYSRLITTEMGKPIAEASAEVDKCALAFDYYADHAAGFLADQPVATEASESKVVFEPVGVVLAIMPWNYPLWQYVRFAAPALAAGNAPVLKHAGNVPQTSLALADLMRLAGAPDGLCPSLLIESGRVGSLIDDDRIAAVTLTGSTTVGRLVAAQAGRALKKQVLELGGSDPFVVLADADLEAAAAVAVKARFGNGGQSCISAKRFIVDNAVADEFVALFAARVRALRVGDPLDPATQLGPLAREDLRDDLHDQVERTLARPGRVLVCGGRPLPGPGWFYEPTIIDGVEPGDAIFGEETFGPVAAVVRARDAAHAVALANDTEFGLGAALWTRDLDLARRLVPEFAAGSVFVNGMVASDPRLPFGGIKASGYGRELGEFGLREFVNVKTVWIGA